ncbi:hypothetical protein NLX67_20060 [Domibacillus sp. A3M-37]|jgi:hypothetical protein|uniref:hypothetical protein n=1 Tax=Domibacillus sp. A3M-37 TaxID=2962037 RepID=UPI0020B7410C|nr:hypothetical protein [Domibacillus sp. A3M-37]MCP3764639.1 hypothetical protein [Domibacillus sp. A3M-37]
MTYRGAIIEQQWTPEEVAAYYKKFEAKRPAYVREANERLGTVSRRGENIQSTRTEI